MKKLALLLLLASTPLAAQNAPSGSLRVQGAPTGYGDPVQVTVVSSSGGAATSDVNVAKVNGATVTTGNGTASGAQRVTIASDNTAFGVTATGNAASGSADSGNPVKVGAIYNSTLPTFTNGQRGDVQVGSRGSLNVQIFGQDTANGTAVTGITSDGTSPGNNLNVLARPVVFNGSTWDRQRGDLNGTVVEFGLSSTYWRYTSGTSPILSNTTTAVTIKAAAGAGVKIMLDSCEIGSTALGASVPLAIRDGAAGTVIWAVRPPTAGWLSPVSFRFVPPLVGTANTLMEIVTTTADTSGTFDVNCQGHTGS